MMHRCVWIKIFRKILDKVVWGGGIFTQQTQTVPNMKRILKSSFYGLILSVIISIPYNEGPW